MNGYGVVEACATCDMCKRTVSINISVFSGDYCILHDLNGSGWAPPSPPNDSKKFTRGGSIKALCDGFVYYDCVLVDCTTNVIVRQDALCLNCGCGQ